MIKHGQSNTRLYTIWEHVKARCLNKNDDAYRHYGGRGITICNDWLDFIPFYNWAITNGYNEKLTIDRIDVNKGYYPENCRWATRKQQSNNTRITKRINYNGTIKTLSEWSDELCINPDTLYSRIFRWNWSIERAFTTPTNKNDRSGIEFNGKTQSIAAWANDIGISKATLWARFKAKWPLEKALIGLPFTRHGIRRCLND